MDNQHRKISGYRELSQEEIDLMNRVKAKGAELLVLQAELVDLFKQQQLSMFNKVDQSVSDAYHAAHEAELKRFNDAEPLRWAAIAKTDIQTGIMALVRAIAQPTTF